MEEKNRIKEIRGKTGLSQKKFGEKYNISSRTIEDWESGRRKPPIYVIELLERDVNREYIKE